MFTRLAGSDGEIDSEELQDILTASFSKGELKTQANTNTLVGWDLFYTCTHI